MNLATKWRENAAVIEKYAPPVAQAFRDCAAELEAREQAAAREAVGLTEAHVLSGFAVNSLSEMVRDGRLTNYGSKNRPKVRVADLPKKPGPKQLDSAVLAFNAVRKKA